MTVGQSQWRKRIEELEEEENNPLASCLPDTFTVRKSSQVPFTSMASHTVERSTIPKSQSVRSEATPVLSEKRATQHVEKQSCGREHTAPESTAAGKPRESKSKSHAWSSATASKKSNPHRKLHEESKIPLRKRRQRSPTPESRRYRGRNEQIVKERRRLMERLRDLDREQDDARSRTPDRRGIPTVEVCGSTRTRGYGSGMGRRLTGRVGYGYEVHVFTRKDHHFFTMLELYRMFFVSSFLKYYLR